MPTTNYLSTVPACDVLVVIAHERAVHSTLAPAVNAELAAHADRMGAAFTRDEVVSFLAPTPVPAQRVVVASVENLDATSVRGAVAAAVRSLTRAAHVAIAAPADHLTQAVTQGGLLGAYSFTSYLTPKPGHVPLETITVVGDPAQQAAFDEAVTIATAVNSVRDLVNTPANDAGPADIAELAKTVAKGSKFTVNVLDEKGLAAGNFAGLLAVGQGSRRGPRLVTLEYSPRGARAHVALVGKGIVFDSGGLSLKPPKSMERMKDDMAGAATVLYTVAAAAKLGLKVKITGYLCLAENMPSGSAQRPGDIIRYANGTSVEVLNTDAEGRLVLADGLIAASASGADAVIDIATLTGAAVVALGPNMAGIMGNEDLRAALVKAAAAVGEQAWAMPLPADLKPSISSPIADLTNTGGPHGGMLTAGLFLQAFAQDNWAHIDIAGPAFNEHKPAGVTPKGGTGFGVRLLLEYLRGCAEAGA